MIKWHIDHLTERHYSSPQGQATAIPSDDNDYDFPVVTNEFHRWTTQLCILAIPQEIATHLTD